MLIACAKIMTGKAPNRIPFCTEPTFQTQAKQRFSLTMAWYFSNLHRKR